MLCCTYPKSSWICSDSWLCWTCWRPIAVAPVVPARVTPRSTGRRMGSSHQLVSLGIQQLQSWETCPGLGLRKPGHNPPPHRPRNRCESCKVSPIRCFGSFHQFGTIIFVTQAFSFSSYLDSWAHETGIVVLG
jgi:hypothetical protein